MKHHQYRGEKDLNLAIQQVKELESEFNDLPISKDIGKSQLAEEIGLYNTLEWNA